MKETFQTTAESTSEREITNNAFHGLICEVEALSLETTRRLATVSYTHMTLPTILLV